MLLNTKSLKGYFFLTVFLFAFMGQSIGQLSNGAIAKDWTLDDTNNVIHNLYTELNAGKGAIVKFSATWCSPCWSYHNTNTLKDIYNTYGPNGTDEARVYYIEASTSTNEGCLFGPASCSGSTQGDWTAGTPYPLIHLDGAELAVSSDYQVAFFPTIYVVSPDKRAFQVGQASFNTLTNWLTKSFKMTATATVTDALCGLGSIDLSISEGYGNKSYLWSNGNTSQDLTNVPPGLYSVKITDTNGYFIEKSYTISGPSQTLSVQYVNHSDVSCNGAADGSVSVSGQGGWNGYSYQWDTGQNGNTATNLSGGFYTVTVTDLNGCTAIDLYEIIEPEPLEAFSAFSNASCNENNGQLDITGIGGTGPIFYELGPGNGNFNGLFFQLSPGTYTTTLTDINGCTTSHSATIGEITPPIAMASVIGQISCTNPQVELVGNGSSSGAGISYQWSTSDGNILSGANSLNAIADKSGEYILSVSDASGCIIESMVMVDEDTSLPTAVIIGDDQLTCVITQLELCVDTDTNNSINWIQANNSSQTCIMITSAGSYQVEVTAPNGCTELASIEITTSDDQPEVTISEPGLIDCIETTATLTASILGDPAHFSLQWTTTNGSIISNTDEETIVVNQSGSYTVEVTNLLTGCSTNKIKEVFSEISPANSSFSYTIDNEGIIHLENTSNVSDQLSWEIDGNNTSGDESLSINFQTNGDYIICLTATNECGPDTYCETINYATVLIAESSQLDMQCHNDNMGMASINLSGGRAPYQVEWAGPNGFMATGISINNLSEGNYAYLAKDDFGYEKQGIITIENVPALIIDQIASTNLSCFEDASGSIIANASGGTGTIDYAWSNGRTTPLLSGLSAGEYTLTVKDENACIATSSVTLSQPDSIVISSSGNLELACFGDVDATIKLEVSGGTGNANFLWSDGSIDQSITNLSAGIISVVVSDDNNCSSSQEFTISQPDALMVDDVSVKADINGQGGSVELDIIGGTGEYNYLWNTGATSRGIFALEAGEYSCIVTDENNCSLQTETYTVSFLSSVEEIEGLESFDFYPNPVTDRLQISVKFESARTFDLYILDINGKILYQRALHDIKFNDQLNLNKLSNGIYLLAITTSEASKIYKIIKH